MNPTSPFDSSLQMLNKVLDLRSANQRIISSNIANAETPGYSPAKFEFEDELSNAINTESKLQLRVSDAHHIPIGPTNFNSVTGKITISPDTTGIGDKNGVSVDEEMIALSKNELMYETTTQILKKKLSLLKYAISDGR